jgi:hypothetical protein
VDALGFFSAGLGAAFDSAGFESDDGDFASEELDSLTLDFPDDFESPLPPPSDDADGDAPSLPFDDLGGGC